MDNLSAQYNSKIMSPKELGKRKPAFNGNLFCFGYAVSLYVWRVGAVGRVK